MTRAVTEVEVVDMAAVAAVDMAVVARKGRRRRRQTLWRDLGVTVHSTTACVFFCSSIKMVLPRFPDFTIALARIFAHEHMPWHVLSHVEHRMFSIHL